MKNNNTEAMLSDSYNLENIEREISKIGTDNQKRLSEILRNHHFFSNFRYNGNSSEKGDNAMADVNWQEKFLDQILEGQRLDREERIAHRQEMQELRKENNAANSELRGEFRSLRGEIDSLKTQVHTEMSEMHTEFNSTKKWIIGISITTILGIAAMVLTVILTQT